jgi:ankyrin repeat protein
MDHLTSLFEKASSGNLAEITQLVATHKYTYDNTRYALALAAEYGHLDVVKYFANNYINHASYDDYYYNIPICCGARNGHLEVVRYLCQHTSLGSQAALMEAITNHHTEIIHYFLENNVHLDIDSQPLEQHKWYAMIQEGSFDTLCQVIEHSLKCNHKTDDLLGSILTFACSCNRIDIIHYIIALGANIGYNDNTPLKSAVLYGNMQVLRLLIDHGVDFRACEEKLCESIADGGYFEMMHYLIDIGIDLPKYGWYPLVRAARSSHLNIVNFLIDSGVNIHECFDCLLNDCIRNKNLLILNNLITNYPEEINMTHTLGRCIDNCFVDAIIPLIELGADYDKYGHGIMELGKFDIIQYMVNLGYDIDDYQKYRLLVWAVESKLKCNNMTDLDIFKYLIDIGADINYHGNSQILYVATFLNNIPIVQFLINQDTNIFDYNQAIGKAAIGGNLEVFKLLQYAGADIYQPSLLDTAICNGSFGIVDYLAKSGVPTDNYMVILQAIQSDNLDVVQSCIDDGFDIKKYNRVLMMYCAKYDSLKIMRYLIGAGVEIEFSMLNIAAENGNLEIICYLMELKVADASGDELFQINFCKKEALAIAAINGRLDIVEYLIENGVEFQDSALDEVALSGHLNMVRYLVDNVVYDNWNDSLIDQLVAEGRSEIAAFLKSRRGRCY